MINGNIPNSLTCVRKLIKLQLKYSINLNFDRFRSSKFKIMQTNHNDYSNNFLDTYLSRFVVVYCKIKIHLTYVCYSCGLTTQAKLPKGGKTLNIFNFRGTNYCYTWLRKFCHHIFVRRSGCSSCHGKKDQNR